MSASSQPLFNIKSEIKIADNYEPKSNLILFHGDCLDLLAKVPSESVDLIITSPPYNLGKPYEDRLDLDSYLDQQAAVILECIRVLRRTGSICWQVGNYVDRGSIIPLDAILYPTFAKAGLRMRNRIVWHFEDELRRGFLAGYEAN
jgi:DNA modification methylase